MSGFRIMTPKEVQKMTKLAESEYRPKEILELQARIDGETRAAELRASAIGEIDEAKVQEIVGMKFELDALYTAWIDGTIS